MNNYMITIEYDGTAYRGWQVQGNTNETIQGKLQNILGTLTGSPVEVHGSGRTDAGVHALGQVANFRLTPDTLPPMMDESGLLLYINKYLPEDIAVTSLSIVDERFHARLSAVSKTYRYRIHVSPVSDVFQKKYVYTYTDSTLDVDAMKLAASYMLGEHDFKSFCGNRHMKKSTVRTVTDIKINEIKDTLGREEITREITMDFTGNGFLQNMVRIMTGTLIEVGSGQKSPEDMPAIIEAQNRNCAGYTAPAQGLCLMKVCY